MIEERTAYFNMLLVLAVSVLITETLNIDSTKNCNYLVVMMTVIGSLKMGDKKRPILICLNRKSV